MTKTFGRLSIVALIAALTSLAIEPTKANAQVSPPYPDAIQCTFSGTGGSSGPRIFYLIAQQGGTPLQLIYRQPRDGTNYDFFFSYSDGSYASKAGVPVSTSCDSQSLAQIQTAGAAYYLSSVAGSVPSGAVVQFALSACPTGWTLQTISTSSIILCQKN
jgi:hypothetical protein